MQSYFVVFDIEPRRARTRILKTTKKFPCRIIDRGHFYFARRGQSYYARRGQSRVPEGVKLTRLFHKMHYAVHGHTAAELIIERANAEKEHMGLTTWENAPDGKIVKPDVSIAKNYLQESELEDMGRIVNSFLDLAEDMAKRHIPMTMEDWAKRIDRFLDLTDRPVLTDAGHVSAEQAKEYAETEFEKYRVIQDKLFQSDFDRFNNDNLLPLDIE